MKKLLIIIIASSTLLSCTKSTEEICNIDPTYYEDSCVCYICDQDGSIVYTYDGNPEKRY